MKILLITFALLGLAAAAQLPDSATQGPNPQDIATPEPEYIDIDLPEPPAPAPAPAPVARHSFVSAPLPAPAPAPRPVQRPVQQYIAPQRSFAPAAPVPGHSYSRQSGYQYRRPVYVRRVYRRRFF